MLALVKALLINSAIDVNGYGTVTQEAGLPIPNNHEGWGRINLAAATNGTNRDFVDDQSLTTSTTHVYSFTNTSTATPLKTSLVWTDYPGNPAAGTQLVNNLNLSVIAPDGTTTYLGNNFSGGWSATGGNTDTVNNVENVYIQSPAAGLWTIEVTGQNVPFGPQPYALVVAGQGSLSGPSSSPGSGTYIYLPLILKGGESGSSCVPDSPGESNNINDALKICSGTTASGQVSRHGGDIDDVYKISISAGQMVTISMNGSGGDADLYLFPPGTTDVTTDPWADRSINAGNNEFIQGTALVSGFWYVDIFSYSDTTNYDITVTLATPLTGHTKTFDLDQTDLAPDRLKNKVPD